MEELTQRQIDILKSIIQEYTETGEPVGSEILEKKYKLGISPATIRNEMVILAKKGYIRKSHFSSGRIPSAKGFRFYIQTLMPKKDLSTVDEVAYKNSIWDERGEIHRLLSQATKVLAKKTNLLSLAATDRGELFYAGVANLFNLPEFLDLNLSKTLFERLDEVDYWEKILEQVLHIDRDIFYFLDQEDFNDPIFETCACVFGEFKSEKTKGIIGVVGPKRMSYDIITPQISYFSSLIESILKNQG
ncbi:MAG: hypothetical protein QHH09_03390 [Microgenomates group bacterium]|nr:hypothetical protein [Microgenomates group bacterium]